MDHVRLTKIAVILESFEPAQIADMVNSIKNVIIHVAVNPPKKEVDKHLITEDMQLAKNGSDVLESLATALEE